VPTKISKDSLIISHFTINDLEVHTYFLCPEVLNSQWGSGGLLIEGFRCK
jgi:hypothetical protein